MDGDPATHHAASARSPPLTGLFSSANRSPTFTKSAMGQAESTVRQPEPQLQGVAPQPPLSPQPASKYRFGWPGRRKKSEDFTKFMNAPPSPGPSPSPTPPSSFSKGRDRELLRQESNVSQAQVDSSQTDLRLHELSRPPSRTSSAKQLTLQLATTTLTALKGRFNASQASIHSHRAVTTPPITPPPPLPPKPDIPRLSSSSSTSSSMRPIGDWIPVPAPDRSKPLPPTSAAPVPATEVETQSPEIVPTATGSSEDDVNLPQRRERGRREKDPQSAKEIADDWRKSDSTLRTVRLVGSRTPRPVSLAESTNSGHTVLPSVGASSAAANMGAGKRLSALMTDVDFGLPEVDSEDDDDDDSVLVSAPPSAFNSMHNLQQQAPSATSSRSSSPASHNSGKPLSKRSSLSIRIGRLSGSKTHASEFGHMSGSDSDALSSSVSTRGTGMGMGMFTANSSTTSVTSSSADASAKDSRPSVEIASTASIASSMSSERRAQQYANYRSNSKLEPWISLSPTKNAASNSQASLSTAESASTSSHTGSVSRHTDMERNGPPPTSMHASPGSHLRPAHQRNRLQSIQARGFRQTAVSLTAPAAGFARKAADRLGRALGGSGASNEQEEMHSGNNYPPSASASNSAVFGNNGQGLHVHSHLHQNMQGQHQRQHHAHGHTPHHAPSSAKKALRRHAPGPSGTWSLGSNSASTSDTDGMPAGPNLGRCMRGPLGGQMGLVFGKDLAQCVQDTACEVGFEVEGSVGGLALEGRRLPAVVVRCAQHIVKWGVQEEGLFRISGRSTHVAKLRAEFDSGADFDLRECGPGEIDPHAVSSIFKAYLRELPEPLLTRHLMPYFEAALTAENNMIIAADAQKSSGNIGHERMRGPGLPSGPRDSVQVRKAPSLSTFAVPTLSPRTASDTLLKALTALIVRLPCENRDLLRTVTELISLTARASRETKMPLSNLLLVFCPSLMMSPPLLRVLCEGKGIWDGAPEEVEETIVDKLPVDDREEEVEGESNSVDEEEGGSGLQSQRTIRRSPRTSPERTTTTDGPSTSEVTDDTTTTDSQSTTPSSITPPADEPEILETKPISDKADGKDDSTTSTPLNIYSPGGFTNSTNSSDSISTPPSSNMGCSAPNTTVSQTAPMARPGIDTAGLASKVLAMHAQSDLPSPLSPSAARKAVRKSLIGNPVPFPIGLGISRSSSNGNGSGGGSLPATPIERRVSSGHSSSSPNLQDPSLALVHATGTVSPPRLGRRKSKASLLGLASKRSLSSLLGFSQSQAQLAPAPQIVIPDVTLEEHDSEPAPRSSTPCPVLELPLDTSRMQFGLGLSMTDEPEPMTNAPSMLQLPPSTTRPQGSVINRAESDSSALTNSVFYTPPTTTRALAPLNSISAESSSSSGSCSFLDFSISKTEEEDDWAKSVLQAAASDA